GNCSRRDQPGCRNRIEGDRNMSAAATAAGYLYASGRLRGRGMREQEEHAEQPRQEKVAKEHARPAEIRVAALPREERAKRVRRIQYRPRRWRPEQEPHEWD